MKSVNRDVPAPPGRDVPIAGPGGKMPSAWDVWIVKIVALLVDIIVSINDPAPFAGAADYPNDAAAAAGGVPIGGVYRTGSAIKVRVA